MTKLIYPTVSLFLYDLRDGIGQSSEQIDENRLNFWRKSKPEIDRVYKRIQEIHQQTKKNPQPLSDRIQKEVTDLTKKIQSFSQQRINQESSEAEFVELDYQDFAEQEKHLDGMYFALQRGDTYALQVEASDVTTATEPPKREDTLRSLDQLAHLQKLVISKINHHARSPTLDADKLGTLGQTWLVWGKATDQKTTNKQLREIAQECFSQLETGEDWKPDFKEVGELIGAKVFEYTHTPKQWFNHPPKKWSDNPHKYQEELDQFSRQELERFRRENYHLVMLLFPDNDTSTTDIRKGIADITGDLIKLFAYRHKIIWSYWNSRALKAKLKEDSQHISLLQKQIKDSQTKHFSLTNLGENLEESWLLLAEYATRLNQLNSQQYTIEINLSNYKKRLLTIEEVFPQQTNLKIFQNFVTTAEERYLQQVKMDHASLSAGLTILENLTRTIDTLVNIERTKAENRLNTTIAIAGLGLAASSSVAGIVATQVYQPENSDRLSVGVGFAYTVAISLVIVLVGVVGAIGFRQLFRRRR